MAEVMETAEAWIHGNFNRTAVHILETCFAGEVTVVQSMTNGALTQGLEAANSMPWQAFSGLTLAVAMLLMFLGWYLVRAVNLFGGLYIGASVSMFLLTFSAGTPLMGNCSAMISVVTVSSLLCAIICLVYRKSMYLVLGMIAGEIVGKFVYHLCLESAGLGSNTLYITIGFFAMVGAYAVKEVGDLAWMICTALMGSYFATTALVELVLSHLLASLLLLASLAHPSPPHPSSRGLPLRPPGPSSPLTWSPISAGGRPVRPGRVQLCRLPRVPPLAQRQRAPQGCPELCDVKVPVGAPWRDAAAHAHQSAHSARMLQPDDAEEEAGRGAAQLRGSKCRSSRPCTLRPAPHRTVMAPSLLRRRTAQRRASTDGLVLALQVSLIQV